MTLRILATGGTFDKHYDPLVGALGFGDSHLPAAIARARMTRPVAL
jgi:L-asparaginase